MLFYETLGYIKKKLEGEENPNYTKGKKKKAHEAEGKKRIYPTFPPTALYVNRFLYIKGRERERKKKCIGQLESFWYIKSLRVILSLWQCGSDALLRALPLFGHFYLAAFLIDQLESS